MALNRATVDRAAAEHIRLLKRIGAVSERRKREVRQLHERAARNAAAKGRR